MRLRYTRPALRDLDGILDYVAARSPQAAGGIHARIQAVLGLLVDRPRIGAATDDPAIRRIRVAPYPYLIFYEVTDTDVIVHAVRHAARKPSSMPGSPTDPIE